MKTYRLQVRNKAEFYLAIQWLESNGYVNDYGDYNHDYSAFVHGEEDGSILTCAGVCKKCSGEVPCAEITPIQSLLRLEKLERLREKVPI